MSITEIEIYERLLIKYELSVNIQRTLVCQSYLYALRLTNPGRPLKPTINSD